VKVEIPIAIGRKGERSFSTLVASNQFFRDEVLGTSFLETRFLISTIASEKRNLGDKKDSFSRRTLPAKKSAYSGGIR
jgi:hypothetical protein